MMPYVIRDEVELTRKSGEKHMHVSYFKATVMGLFNEFVMKPEDARQFRTKTMCEVFIRNRFGTSSRLKPHKIEKGLE